MPHGAEHPQDHPATPAGMSRDTAQGIMRRYGLDTEGLAPDELKRRWQELARRHHPDLGGETGDMQEINAAYSFLKPLDPAGARDTAYPRVLGLPAWAWAGHGAGAAMPDGVIARRDYSDRNFLKKQLWELSGRSSQEWTLWAFDGQDLLPPVVSYGSDAIFPDMAEAMLRHGRRGFRSPRAVLAQAPDERHELLLLHSDGHLHEPPVALSWSSRGCLTLDRAFLMDLPGRLDALAAGRGF